MPDIEREIIIFVHAVLTGIIMLAFYLCFEVLRHLFPHKSWMIDIEDIGYWCIIAIYLFVQIYHTNNGKIRWFSVLGIVFGIVFLWKICLFFKKIAKKIYAFVERKLRKSP